MATLIAERGIAPWRRRLTLPAYRVVDAARYAGVTSQTIHNWEAGTATANRVVSKRGDGVALSYLQLVELAFVAMLRKKGVKLADILLARKYIEAELGTEFPLASHRFMTDGKDVLLRYNEFVTGEPPETLIATNRDGQLAWGDILGDKFHEFDYQDGEKFAMRWHPRGSNSSVLIDPQVSFGAPIVKGVPTWAVRGRYDAGESREDISEDFVLSPKQVDDALQFEGINLTELEAWH